jgi:DNA-binding transcriptional LysR family regulator
MELRHLRYFVAAAEALNISQAAKHLHVSQPPLSRQIRDLEHEIGTALFDRGHKGLKLTPSGEYFLAEAKKLLSHAQRAVRLAKAADTGKAGQISIAFLSPLGGLFLPRIIRSFKQKFPLVDVDLLEMVPRMQVEALLDNQIDLALVPKAEAELGGEFALEPVMHVELRLALAPEHPLAKWRRIPLAKLRKEQFIIVKRSAAPALHELLLRICRSVGFEPHVVKQSDHAQSILDLVAAGIGVSIVPEHFQRYQSDLVLRHLIPKPPAIPLCMVWRKDDNSPALHALRAMIREHFSQRSRKNTWARAGAAT